MFIAASAAYAADKEQEDSPIGDFMPNFDDLIQYVPKYTVRLGFRGIGGVKSSFSGQGVIASVNEIGAATGSNVNRSYHDGAVFIDQRTVTDSSGSTTAIAPDGFTNKWWYHSAGQASAYDGFIAMNTYTATTNDASSRTKDGSTAFGVELTADRELGSLFNNRVQWGIVTGFSINQIYAETKGTMTAQVQRTTDLYWLGGQAAPDPGYTGPVVANGIDQTVLLGSEPVARLTPATTTGAFTNFWKLRGTYVTFRAGPTLTVPITPRFNATISAGALLVYVGTTYSVEQVFQPETGDYIEQGISDGASRVLPGYFADANLQYTLTETAGFYVGAVYQSSGSYEQKIESSDKLSSYTTKVNFNSLEGLRAGVLFKF